MTPERLKDLITYFKQVPIVEQEYAMECITEIQRLQAALPTPAKEPSGELGEAVEAQEWRPEVKRMADMMEAQLKANEDRGGWKHMRMGEARENIRRNLRDLEFWQHVGSTSEQNLERLHRTCADIANFAMMLSDNAQVTKEGGK